MLLLESKFVFAIVCCCEKALLPVVPEFGYVGEDHIIGRPIMIWANMNGMFEPAAPKKFIWNRFFTSINNDNPDKTSYGIYVLIALIGWIGYDIVKARKEKKKNKY